MDTRLSTLAHVTLKKLAEAGGSLDVAPDEYFRMDAIPLEEMGLVSIHDAGTYGVYSTITLTAEGRRHMGLKQLPPPPPPFFKQVWWWALRWLDRTV